MTNEYSQFLAGKAVKHSISGFNPSGLNKHLKPFQKELVKLALRRGRSALFASTGLGKTIMQLSWAEEVCKQEQCSAIIFTPLAVAHQTVAEAKRFQIKGVEYAQSQDKIKTNIVVTNYDRLDKFDPSEFGAVVLDESSILKGLDGKTRNALIDQYGGCGYKLCATATPAPNDFTELGNHAEFLGIMSFKEMLAMYFVHDGGHLIEDSGSQGWRLKRHAVNDFWKWISSWASILNHPRDLGFDEDGYDLPMLTKRQIVVKGVTSQAYRGFFAPMARTLNERQKARKDSVELRLQAAIDLINSKPTDSWLVWCGLNIEAERITARLDDAEEVAGSHPTDYKMEKLLGFCKRKPRILVTKPKIAGFGMNWQHCHNMIFLGLNDSFEQLFQAIRRCWRFGQEHEVNVYIITSGLEGEVLKNIQRKESAHELMVNSLCSFTKDWLIQDMSEGPAREQPEMNNVKLVLPDWL